MVFVSFRGGGTFFKSRASANSAIRPQVSKLLQPPCSRNGLFPQRPVPATACGQADRGAVPAGSWREERSPPGGRRVRFVTDARPPFAARQDLLMGSGAGIGIATMPQWPNAAMERARFGWLGSRLRSLVALRIVALLHCGIAALLHCCHPCSFTTCPRPVPLGSVERRRWRCRCRSLSSPCLGDSVRYRSSDRTRESSWDLAVSAQCRNALPTFGAASLDAEPAWSP